MSRVRYLAAIHQDSPRWADWVMAIGRDWVEVESPDPIRATFEDESTLFFKARLAALGSAEVDAIAAMMAARFRLGLDEVLRGILGDVGIPIRADDVTIFREDW